MGSSTSRWMEVGGEVLDMTGLVTWGEGNLGSKDGAGPGDCFQSKWCVQLEVHILLFDLSFPHGAVYINNSEFGRRGPCSFPFLD